MELWEFMKAYSEGFWAAGESACEIINVLLAWSLTIGTCLLVSLLLPCMIAWLINDNI